ncbi:hypothetical protein NDU88_002963 [Pleurodeles waltl]|uniref:Uncharacterized protein n=1 Tax=Pleurodeles waltl TaxID=8319 RepID=A0AAV7UCN3_PLEWA|nr:hypothetical protein NDU88_002963 [Pleurodeles waltl]
MSEGARAAAVHNSTRRRVPRRVQRCSDYSASGGATFERSAAARSPGHRPPHPPPRPGPLWAPPLQRRALEGWGWSRAPGSTLTGRGRKRRPNRPPISPWCRRQPRSPGEGRCSG